MDIDFNKMTETVSDSISTTQEHALNITPRILEIAYLSGKEHHDYELEMIRDDTTLTTKERVALSEKVNKNYQRRIKANSRIDGKVQDKQTKNANSSAAEGLIGSAIIVFGLLVTDPKVQSWAIKMFKKLAA